MGTICGHYPAFRELRVYTPLAHPCGGHAISHGDGYDLSPAEDSELARPGLDGLLEVVTSCEIFPSFEVLHLRDYDGGVVVRAGGHGCKDEGSGGYGDADIDFFLRGEEDY